MEHERRYQPDEDKSKTGMPTLRDYLHWYVQEPFLSECTPTEGVQAEIIWQLMYNAM